LVKFYCDVEIKEDETGERCDTPGEFILCTIIVESRHLWEIKSTQDDNVEPCVREALWEGVD
jgi:hypothetical protein